MTAEREAKIRVTAEGHAQAAQAEQQVADAQQHVADSATAKGAALADAAEKADQAAKSTDKVSASQSDLKQILNQINPAFGQMIDSMSAAFKVAGELGTKEIELGKIIESVKNSVTENAAAYKLLAAGGAAAAALVGLAKSWQMVRAEIQATLDLQRQFVEEQNRLRGQREEVRAGIADEFAKQGKSPDSLQEGERFAQRLDDSGFSEQAVPVASALAGEGASFKQVAAFAAAAESGLVDPNAPDPLGQLQAALNRPGGQQTIQDTLNLRMGEERRRRETSARQAEAFGVDRGFTGPLFSAINSQWLLNRSFLADWTDADLTRTGATDEFLRSIGEQFGTDDAESARLLDQFQKWKANVEADRAGKSRPFQSVLDTDLTRVQQIDADLQRPSQAPFDVSELRGQPVQPQTVIHQYQPRIYGRPNHRDYSAGARIRRAGIG